MIERPVFLHEDYDVFDIFQRTVAGLSLGECASHVGRHEASRRSRGDSCRALEQAPPSQLGWIEARWGIHRRGHDLNYIRAALTLIEYGSDLRVFGGAE